MSKTFKTRPLTVRLSDPQDTKVGFQEKHSHHGDRECDLPETVKEQIKLNDEELRNLNCYYNFKYIGHRVCGCPMCTEKFERKIARKKERHSKKKSIEEQM